jgi:hypothetical protein
MKLKVLSSEKDLAKIRLIRKIFIKGTIGEVFFIKIRPSPILWEPFKNSGPSHKVIGNYALNGRGFFFKPSATLSLMTTCWMSLKSHQDWGRYTLLKLLMSDPHHQMGILQLCMSLIYFFSIQEYFWNFRISWNLPFLIRTDKKENKNFPNI